MVSALRTTRFAGPLLSPSVTWCAIEFASALEDQNFLQADRMEEALDVIAFRSLAIDFVTVPDFLGFLDSPTSGKQLFLQLLDISPPFTRTTAAIDLAMRMGRSRQS